MGTPGSSTVRATAPPCSKISEGMVSAFLEVFLHLLSDVFTSAGIQPPFFTLLQLCILKADCERR